MPSVSAAASLLADALSPAEWAVFRHVTGALLGTGMLLGLLCVDLFRVHAAFGVKLNVALTTKQKLAAWQKAAITSRVGG